MNPVNSFSGHFSGPSRLEPLSLPQLPGLEQPGQKEQISFKDFLLSSIHRVNAAQQEADKAVEQLFTGGDITPAEVLTAVQKADLAFRMMIQVRNKLVEAYNQIESIRV